MKTNESTNACPKCGAPVPPEAPQGLCPQCVFAQAVAPEAAPTATSQIPSLERLAVAFPQLQIIELIGRGGMGFVFKARQPHLDRFVALKLLPDSLAHDAHFAERFNREGRTLARLNHPNIVSIFDFGQAGGFYFLLMEYVDGVNLRQAMQAGRFSPSEALSIVPKICEALQFAHEEGILHRDIKPENILLDSKGRVKIADFGIAKIVGEDKPDVSLTATGAALGTPHYMAPEQFEKPATVDHRADIYSLGVVFYELLTGELPIGRFSPPSQRTPLDPRVDEVVMRTLEKEREKRFQSAGEMGTNVEHLTEVGAGARPSAPSPTSVVPAEDFILCHPRLPRMAQLLTVFALVAAPVLWFVGLMTMDDTPHPNVYAEFVQVMMRLVTFWGELLTTVLLFIGGWKLRALKKSGAVLISVALWLNMFILLLAIGGTILIEKLAPSTDSPPLSAGEALLLATQLGSLVFQIIALVWLRRNRAVLNNIFQSAAGAAGPRGTIIIGQTHLVRRPAQALFVTGIVNWVGSIFVIFLLAYTALGETWMLSPAQLSVLAGLILLSSSAIILGALKMMKMESYPLSVVASVLAMITTPGSIIGLPIGLWALVTLRRPEVRAGFAAMKTSAPQRSGALKWALAALFIFGAGVAITIKSRGRTEASQAAPAAVAETNITPWIRFTFTAVELREVKGVRWLAIDYLDDVHGECQKSFPWETTIPGFKAETRTSEFRTDAKGGSPSVRHQRIEYRMPDSSPRDQLERLRDDLEKTLKQKSFRLELSENQVPLTLFELPGVEGGSLKARIKVMPPLKSVAGNNDSEEQRISLARQQLDAVQQRVNAGVSSDSELAQARRDVEIAEARGDAVMEARAKLKYADYALQVAPKRAGLISVEEIRRLGTQQAVAEIELQQALRKKPVKPTGPAPRKPDAAALQFRLVADGADKDSPVDMMVQPQERGPAQQLRVLRTVLLDGSSVARAGVDFDAKGSRLIGVELTTEGARQFGAITAANINRQLAIIAGGKVLSAPVIRTAITGELQISGDMPVTEMYELVGSLNGIPTGLQFSPPVERSLPRAHETQREPQTEAVGLDLDLGTYMTNRSFSTARRTAIFSFETNGVDFVAAGISDQPASFAALGSVLIEVPAGAWDSMPAEEVGWNWKLMRAAAKEYSRVGVAPGGSDTFMFRTHENGFGLVKFLPTTDPAPDVRIRYKLVQAAPAK